MKSYGFLPVICCFLFLHPAYAYPRENESGKSGVITELAVEGLKRTKLSIAESALNQFMGRNADALDLDAVYAAVLDTGVLEPVSIAVEDASDGEGKILSVNVREKWSIFPVPVFFINSGQISGGVFFADTNAFGLNDKFFFGGMYSAEGWMLTSGYVHSGGENIPGWMLTGSFAQSERRDSGPTDEDLRRFNVDSISASAGLSYPLSRVNTSLKFSYQQMTLRETESPLEAPESGARVFGVGAGVSFRKSHWDGYLLSEKVVSTGYTFMAGIESDSFHEIRFHGVYQESLLPGFKVNLNSGLLYQPFVPPLFESSPRSVQISILPDHFSARHYAGVSAGFEKYLFKVSAGVLSAAVSYQAVFSEGPILGVRLDHGAAGAVVFYLSKIAIPAMGIGVSYNVGEKYPQFSFSLGMSF
ncbi:MAG: hypothetical protein LBJ35_02415 [Spirochaetaceae bacterium]|jgi:hypothetical protein|nr:hypothetical protein [Spirochaetaceae bacterium]